MIKLNGQDIISKLISKGYSQTEATKAYKDMVDILSDELSNADTSVTITNVGTFSTQLKDKHPNFQEDGSDNEVFKVKFVPSRNLSKKYKEKNPKRKGFF